MHCIIILNHAIENTVAITIHVAHNGKFAMGVIMSSIQWNFLYSYWLHFLWHGINSTVIPPDSN